MTGRRQTISPGRQRIIEISLAVGTLIFIAVMYALYGTVPAVIVVLLGLLSIGVRQLDLRNARPILMKEMRSRMRGARAPILLLLAAGAAVVVALLILLPGWDDIGSPETLYYRLAKVGQALFTVVTIIIALIVALVTPALASGAVAHEYETQTFDFLISTPLSEAGILGGKLLAAMSFAAMLVVCTLPVTALAFFFGGVALWQVFATPFFILIIAYCLGSIGLYCSTIFRKVAVATTVTYVFCFMLLTVQLLTELVPNEMKDYLLTFFEVMTSIILLALVVIGVLAVKFALSRQKQAQSFFLLKRMLAILLTTLVITVILLVMSESIGNYNEFLYGNPGYSLYLLVGENYELEREWSSVLISAGALLILALLTFRMARYIIRCQRVQPPRPVWLRFRVKPW